MENKRLFDLFQKYIDKTSTPDEYREFMTLVEKSKGKDLEILLDSINFEDANYRLQKPDSDSILAEILNSDRQPVSKIKPWKWFGYAAAAAIIVVSAFGLILKNNRIIEQSKQTKISFKPADDHRLIKFSDGSTVVLNKNSSVKFPATFKGMRREVSLIGEGYFDIKHDTKHPFLVHTGKLTVTVLGTAFNIKSSNGITAVTVTRGKVSVSNERKLLGAIIPNQQISYDDQTKEVQLLKTDARQAIQWQSSDLFFDNVTVKEAAAILETRFGKKIVFTNEGAKRSVFSGAFTHGENLKDILKVVCAYNRVDYEEKENAIIIKRKEN
ncbi:MAG: FecR domain-containing protein [Mucilaginibacter sp.]|uniref:FecR family protein n=1 Tax=Mucilaginibacter sp. TaxID=1882438 RepID=UPI0032647333